jgi:hypothetical protein
MKLALLEWLLVFLAEVSFQKLTPLALVDGVVLNNDVSPMKVHRLLSGSSGSEVVNFPLHHLYAPASSQPPTSLSSHHQLCTLIIS